MKRKASLSHAEMILLAIHRVANGTTNRVPFESIVLQSWQDFPQEFSLNNHPEYPDSYVVSKRLYSDLITKRLVVSLRNQDYRLTDKGLELAQHLERSLNVYVEAQQIAGNYLNKDEDLFIKHALKSRTYLAWKEGKQLVDYDARVFFQFSTSTPVRERKRKLENARDAIEKAVASDRPEASSLKSLLEFLVEKFSDLFNEV